MFAVPSLIHQRRQGRLIGGRALLQDPKGLLVAGLSLQTLLSVIGAASGFQLGPCVLDIRRLGLGRYGEQPPHRRAQQPSYHLVGTRGGLGGGCATASRTLEAGRGVTSIRASGEGMGGNAGGGIMAAVDTARVSLAKNTRWLVAGSAAAVLLLRRDAVSISCIAGAIANAIMSKVLKRVLNQERPEGAAVSDPGMPSSHAMSLFFFASYLSSALLFWIQWPSAARAACVAGMWAFAVNSAAWRVTAGLHTREQVPLLCKRPETHRRLWHHAHWR